MNTRFIDNLYTEKVTVLNKIQGTDIGQKCDIWTKTVVDNTYWVKSLDSSTTTTTFSGSLKSVEDFTKNVISTKVMFADLSNYKPYVDLIKYLDNSNFFTLSLGDYVVNGIVLDEITSQNVREVIEKYKGYVCKITNISFPKNRGISKVKLIAEGVS